jgi:WD40 repeat protein
VSAGHLVNASLQADTSCAQPTGAAFSPDNQTLAVLCSNRTIRLFSTSTARPTGTQFTIEQHTVGANAVPGGIAFSPDGQTLAVGYGTTVQLLNARTGSLIGAPVPTEHAVRAVAFSPDGQTLAVIEDNGDLWLPRTAPFLDPYPSLCAGVGLPSADAWSTYAPDEPPPPAESSCLQWRDG